MRLFDLFRPFRLTPAPVSALPARAKTMRFRPYQLTGTHFLRTVKRGVLCDAPGLGKTFQATEATELPAIISCPVNLCDQWAEFIAAEYPQDRVSVAAYGTPRERQSAIDAEWDWLIVNHDMWRKYFMPSINTLILDEMHHFRGRNAKRSEMLALRAQMTPRVYGLTATPIYKDVSDLYHLLHVLDPSAWKSYWQFVDRYAITADYGYGVKIVRTKPHTDLRSQLIKYMLGRTYKDVGMYLPPRIDKQVVLRLTKPQQDAYIRIKQDYKLKLDDGTYKRFFNASEVEHTLRRFTMTPEKIATIHRIIDDTPMYSDGNGDARTDRKPEPVIVFTKYRESASRIAEALGGALITGDMDPRERRTTALYAKQRVRVATIDSITEGVDLSDYRTVIFAEEDYVPGKQYQALSRVLRHRPDGRQGPVIVYYIRYQRTVDMAVHRAVQTRITDAGDVVREALADT